MICKFVVLLFIIYYLLFVNSISSRDGQLCIVRKEHIRAFAEPEDSIPPSSAQKLLELVSLATVWDDEIMPGKDLLGRDDLFVVERHFVRMAVCLCLSVCVCVCVCLCVFMR